MKTVARAATIHRTPLASRPRHAVPARDVNVKRQSPPLWLPAIPTVIFACFILLPRVNKYPHLLASFLGAAALLVAGLCALWWNVVRTGRILTYEFVPRRAHWVQMLMQGCFFTYWAFYWREVPHELPLMLAQVAFIYALDIIVCWFRRTNWVLGFGPFPIVFSMNLFLWFRDDWFYLQFVMVAMIVLGKEFLKWKRDGHLTHIFNPSALALFVTSVVLIATSTTSITWGPEISTTFNSPPNVYYELFLLGLIVQGLFSVTLVTLSAASMLFVLNIAYTHATGMYQFVDFNIDPAVFLGLLLLVTDPSTSPRRNFGKAIFGAVYGAGVFVAFGWLDSHGIPQFYDKLLCVPVLNLTVRALDRASIALSAWFARRQWVIEGKFRPVLALSAWTPRQFNFGFMGIWVALFAFMMTTGFLGGKQPGSDPAFWEKACAAGHSRGCRIEARALDVQCQHNTAQGCFNLGTLLSAGKGLPRDPIGAARSFVHACDIGFTNACTSLVSLVQTDGDGVLGQPCSRGDGVSCFLLGSMYYGGQGVSRNLEYSARLFDRSCAAGVTRACGQLGESYLFGEGVPKDMARAAQTLGKACDGGYGPACFNIGIMHRQGIATPKNEPLAEASFRRGCDLGYRDACKAIKQSAPVAR